eukprot:2012425-Amphidinium_carterae.1
MAALASRMVHLPIQVHLPLDTVRLRGRNKFDPMNLGQRDDKLWIVYKDAAKPRDLPTTVE